MITTAEMKRVLSDVCDEQRKRFIAALYDHERRHRRERIAGHALQGMIASGSNHTHIEQAARAHADRLIAELDKYDGGEE